MNYIENDKGEIVIAVGEPGSPKRMETQYPKLIHSLNYLHESSYDVAGRAIDKAVEMIRDAGVSDYKDTSTILSLTRYGKEPGGSVASMVIRIGAK